jgi:hypothetical protein
MLREFKFLKSGRTVCKPYVLRFSISLCLILILCEQVHWSPSALSLKKNALLVCNLEPSRPAAPGSAGVLSFVYLTPKRQPKRAYAKSLRSGSTCHEP